MGKNVIHPNTDSGKENIQVNGNRVAVKSHVRFYNSYPETIE